MRNSACGVGARRDRGGVDSGDRGAVDEIAVGRARASATSPRVTRGTVDRNAPTAERSHRQSQR